MPMLRRGSIGGAVVNLTIGALGVAVLTIPSAFYTLESPFIGAALVAAVAVLSMISMDFLASSMEHVAAPLSTNPPPPPPPPLEGEAGENDELDDRESGVDDDDDDALYSYEGLSEVLLGPQFVAGARVMLFLFNFGDCVGYILVSGQICSRLFGRLIARWFSSASGAEMWQSATLWMGLYWAVVLMPLSFVRHVTLLERGSAAAVVVVLLLAVAMAYRASSPSASADAAILRHVLSTLKERRAAEQLTTYATAYGYYWLMKVMSVPLVFFAFDCQALVFPIFEGFELGVSATVAHRSAALRRVAVISMSLVAFIFAAIGTIGYYHCHRLRDLLTSAPSVVVAEASQWQCPDNILEAYALDDDVLMMATALAFLIPVTLAFALVFFPVRDVIVGCLPSLYATTVPSSSCRASRPPPVAPSAVELCADSPSMAELASPDGIQDDDPAAEVSQSPLSIAMESGDAFRLDTTSATTTTTPHPSTSLAMRFYGVSFGVTTMMCFVAMVAPGLDTVFGLLGAVCSSGLCYVYPALFRMALHKQQLLPFASSSKRIGVWALLGLGVTVGIIGTVGGVYLAVVME